MPARLSVQDLEPGEAWAKGIQKLQLVHRDSGPLGSIYLDLHPRRACHAAPCCMPGSMPGQRAHLPWTLPRCTPASPATCSQRAQLCAPGATRCSHGRRQGKFGHAAHFTLRCGCERADGSYQLPLVALVCNFGGSDDGDQLNAHLSHTQVLLAPAALCTHRIPRRLAIQQSRPGLMSWSGNSSSCDRQSLLHTASMSQLSAGQSLCVPQQEQGWLLQ